MNKRTRSPEVQEVITSEVKVSSRVTASLKAQGASSPASPAAGGSRRSLAGDNTMPLSASLSHGLLRVSLLPLLFLQGHQSDLDLP